ncbi:hypothetical protein C8A00DRAFT_35811 [Chaetomidium leptoderma]|uniref:Secreted protein n=1 Tax=Chaetomidium leptoderma TaxID=669021 RepID=A0AAN6VJH3_9PEZI|nr:hypothetical protein C8A00DRAFT_35811 [Chaetomidium leptoderma]
MYLNVPVLLTSLVALATTASADYLDVTVICVFGGCNNVGYFTTAHGTYQVNANDGCRGTSVPDMTEFCVDWKNGRAHFKFKGWTTKSCLKETKSDINGCGPMTTCGTSNFTPIKCTW